MATAHPETSLSSAPTSPPPMQKVWRRGGILAVVIGYIAVSVYFAVHHMMGDPLSHSSAYFFTWNMFPGYTTETSRRMVVGVTAEGRYIQILPAANHHFRWGINNEVARIDVDRRLENLKPEIEKSLRRFLAEHPDDPVMLLLIVEQYWPSKYNLPDDLYEATFGKPNLHPRYWRVLNGGEFAVGNDGRPVWEPTP